MPDVMILQLLNNTESWPFHKNNKSSKVDIQTFAELKGHGFIEIAGNMFFLIKRNSIIYLLESNLGPTEIGKTERCTFKV